MVRILRMNVLSGDKLKAFADVEINDVKVNGLKVIKDGEELYVVYPSGKGKDGKYYDIVTPITQEVEENVKKVVLDYYKTRI